MSQDGQMNSLPWPDCYILINNVFGVQREDPLSLEPVQGYIFPRGFLRRDLTDVFGAITPYPSNSGVCTDIKYVH